jgi:hypothetical protein
LRIAEQFQKYTRSLFPSGNSLTIVPKTKTHELCLDLIKDKSSWRRLISLLKPYRQVTLLSYCASPQFYRLKAALARAGIAVSTPEAPDSSDAWTVAFFGSKAGIRQLAQRPSAAKAGLIMPDGLICSGKVEASRVAAHKYINRQGVVIKSNHGSSSNGILIFRPNDLPKDYPACAAKLERILGREPYWEKFPIVVEDFIEPDSSLYGGFPSIEFKIKSGGKIEMLFFGFMIVTDKGEYYGMDVSRSILPQRLKRQMLKAGHYLAKEYAAAGYRGHFDIDMIAAKNGRLYVCESNTRNTGWTDTYLVVKKLIGPDWLKHVYVFNRECLLLKKKRWRKLNHVLTAISSLLYSPAAKKGIIINSEYLLRFGYLDYVVIAPDKTTAYAYEKKMMKILEK